MATSLIISEHDEERNIKNENNEKKRKFEETLSSDVGVDVTEEDENRRKIKKCDVSHETIDSDFTPLDYISLNDSKIVQDNNKDKEIASYSAPAPVSPSSIITNSSSSSTSSSSSSSISSSPLHHISSTTPPQLSPLSQSTLNPISSSLITTQHLLSKYNSPTENNECSENVVKTLSKVTQALLQLSPNDIVEKVTDSEQKQTQSECINVMPDIEYFQECPYNFYNDQKLDLKLKQLYIDRCKFIKKGYFNENGITKYSVINIEDIESYCAAIRKTKVIVNFNADRVNKIHTEGLKSLTPFTIMHAVKMNYSKQIEINAVLNMDKIGELKKYHYENDKFFSLLKDKQNLCVMFNQKLKHHPEAVIAFGHFVIILLLFSNDYNSDFDIYFQNLDIEIKKMFDDFFHQNLDSTDGTEYHHSWAIYIDNYIKNIKDEEKRKKYLLQKFQGVTIKDIIRVNKCNKIIKIFPDLYNILKERFCKVTRNLYTKCSDDDEDEEDANVEKKFENILDLLKQLNESVIYNEKKYIDGDELPTILNITKCNSDSTITLTLKFQNINNKNIMKIDISKLQKSKNLLSVISYIISNYLKKTLIGTKKFLKKSEYYKITLNVNDTNEDQTRINNSYTIIISNTKSVYSSEMEDISNIDNKFIKYIIECFENIGYVQIYQNKITIS